MFIIELSILHVQNSTMPLKGEKDVGMWVLVRAASGLEVVQEGHLNGGPTFYGSDVQFTNLFGDTVPAVVMGVDRVKRKMMEEMSRLRGTMDEETEGNEVCSLKFRNIIILKNISLHRKREAVHLHVLRVGLPAVHRVLVV